MCLKGLVVVSKMEVDHNYTAIFPRKLEKTPRMRCAQATVASQVTFKQGVMAYLLIPSTWDAGCHKFRVSLSYMARTAQ